MSAVTPTEQLPYPCLTDPFARHWIQDLAEAADLSLNRIKSDVALVEQRPKAQARRPTGVQTLPSGNSTTTITYSAADYDQSPAWVNTATGEIIPIIAGLYYVEFSIDPIAAPSMDALVVELQYNAASKIVRKWDRENRWRPLKLAGLVLVNAPGVGAFRSRLTIYNAGATVDFASARLACQFLVRCNPPINANPYFEKDAANWSIITNVTSIARSTVQKYRGNASLLVTPSATAWAVGSEHVTGIVVGTSYQAVVYVNPATAQTMHAEIRWYTAADVFISTTAGTNTAVTGGTWNFLTVTGTAPATAARGQLVIAHNSASAVATYIDDATLYKSC